MNNILNGLEVLAINSCIQHDGAVVSELNKIDIIYNKTFYCINTNIIDDLESLMKSFIRTVITEDTLMAIEHKIVGLLAIYFERGEIFESVTFSGEYVEFKRNNDFEKYKQIGRFN